MKEEKTIKWKLFRGLVDIFVLAGIRVPEDGDVHAPEGKGTGGGRDLGSVGTESEAGRKAVTAGDCEKRSCTRARHIPYPNRVVRACGNQGRAVIADIDEAVDGIWYYVRWLDYLAVYDEFEYRKPFLG